MIFFFFQAEDGIRDLYVTGVQTCALPIWAGRGPSDLQMIETPALNVSAGLRAGAQIAELPAGRRPTGVFCANDLIALGLLQEMTLREIGVPADIAIVGYDDIEFAAAAAVPLSSVRQPRQ